MTNTSLAIQKAVEGGYDGEKLFKTKSPNILSAFSRANALASDVFQATVLLDPLFWQALGKSLGWGATKNFSGRKKDSLLDLWPEEWQVYQHLLIDAIQQGRSIDEFFGEILKK